MASSAESDHVAEGITGSRSCIRGTERREDISLRDAGGDESNIRTGRINTIAEMDDWRSNWRLGQFVDETFVPNSVEGLARV